MPEQPWTSQDAGSDRSKTSPEPSQEPRASRTCGRCRQSFPPDLTLHPVAQPEWWLCAPCHDALFAPAH